MSDKDNWKHRSKGMVCGTCMFFVEKVADSAGELQTAAVKVSFGRFRRHAPTMNGFPAIFATDWCGDHKLNENKI